LRRLDLLSVSKTPSTELLLQQVSKPKSGGLKLVHRCGKLGSYIQKLF
jgi:hypothetical protein